MSEQKQYRFELICNGCGHGRVIDADLIAQMSEILHRNITVTALRTEDPLFSKITCSECGARGREITLLDRKEEYYSVPGDPGVNWEPLPSGFWQWCHVCGSSIERGRLKIFPETNTCMKCKDTPITNKPTIEDRCPRCGGVLVDRTPREGLTRYFRGCSNFPKCRYTD